MARRGVQVKQENKKKLVNGMMITLAVLMVGSMAVMFTPNVQQMMSNTSKKTAFKVNGFDVKVDDLENSRQNNPIMASVDKGPLADDFKTLLMAQSVQQQVLLSAAKDIKVSKQDINAEVDKVRKQNNLQDNAAWTNALRGIGLSDAEYRKNTKDQLAIERKLDEIKSQVEKPTTEELELLYKLNKDQYQSAPKIIGRQIVVKDKSKADKLLQQAKAGENFASLAREHSLEFKDRGGALGPIKDGKPKAVERAALPDLIANAAFGLTSGGLTDVIEHAGRFYIVRVESYLKATPKPFTEVKDDIIKLATKLKENAKIESWLTDLEKSAKIEDVDPEWKYHNPVLAKVNNSEVKYAELIKQIASNQQLGAMLSQMPAEQVALMVNNFKHELTKQLINSHAAPEIVKKLKLPLVGPKQTLAMNLVNYAGRDVKVSEDEIKKYYNENKEQYSTPASAKLDEASFSDVNQAMAFRKDWNGQGDFITAATKAGGTVSERGEVNSGSGRIDPILEKAVFEGQLRGVGDGSLSEVVGVAGRHSVAYVKDLQRSTVKALNDVSDDIRRQLEGSKKAEAGEKFLDEHVSALKPVNNLEKILEEQTKRLGIAEKAAKEKAAEDAKLEETNAEAGSEDSANDAKPDPDTSDKETESPEKAKDTQKDQKAKENDSDAGTATEEKATQETTPSEE